jgi:hypothetical protein
MTPYVAELKCILLSRSEETPGSLLNSFFLERESAGRRERVIGTGSYV